MNASTPTLAQPGTATFPTPAPPKLGFIGTGWIGRLRMQALLQSNCAEFCAVYDPSSEAARAAAVLKPGTEIYSSIDALLEADLDGVVIATPSALHAEHCLQALAHGLAVFCQKPLARTFDETQSVVSAARAADRLLAVDFSYRHLAGMNQLRQLLGSGELGHIFSAELVFHNAYGPDKPWFYDVTSAGGGCVMDLGIHLVDLAMWLLNNTEVQEVSSRLFHQGQQLQPPLAVVEDYALADVQLGETALRLACSWNVSAGRDAVIEASFYGTQGGAALRNVNGSFFDFEVHRFNGTAAQQLAGYPDDWGGRALTAWVEQLAGSPRYDSSVEGVLQVARLVDRIYGR